MGVDEIGEGWLERGKQEEEMGLELQWRGWNFEKGF